MCKQCCGAVDRVLRRKRLDDVVVGRERAFDDLAADPVGEPACLAVASDPSVGLRGARNSPLGDQLNLSDRS